MVVGRDGIEAEIQELLLDGVDLRGVEAHRGQDGTTIALRNTDQDVTTPQVVDVVGEGAEGVQNSFRVPAFLELQAFPFDGFAVQEVIDVDG
jgi:hypothetical protein